LTILRIQAIANQVHQQERKPDANAGRQNESRQVTEDLPRSCLASPPAKPLRGVRTTARCVGMGGAEIKEKKRRRKEEKERKEKKSAIVPHVGRAQAHASNGPTLTLTCHVTSICCAKSLWQVPSRSDIAAQACSIKGLFNQL
jgi:hypothetical protein